MLPLVTDLARAASERARAAVERPSPDRASKPPVSQPTHKQRGWRLAVKRALDVTVAALRDTDGLALAGDGVLVRADVNLRSAPPTVRRAATIRERNRC